MTLITLWATFDHVGHTDSSAVNQGIGARKSEQGSRKIEMCTRAPRAYRTIKGPLLPPPAVPPRCRCGSGGLSSLAHQAAGPAGWEWVMGQRLKAEEGGLIQTLKRELSPFSFQAIWGMLSRRDAGGTGKEFRDSLPRPRGHYHCFHIAYAQSAKMPRSFQRRSYADPTPHPQLHAGGVALPCCHACLLCHAPETPSCPYPA